MAAFVKHKSTKGNGNCKVDAARFTTQTVSKKWWNGNRSLCAPPCCCDVRLWWWSRASRIKFLTWNSELNDRSFALFHVYPPKKFRVQWNAAFTLQVFEKKPKYWTVLEYWKLDLMMVLEEKVMAYGLITKAFTNHPEGNRTECLHKI